MTDLPSPMPTEQSVPASCSPELPGDPPAQPAQAWWTPLRSKPVLLAGAIVVGALLIGGLTAILSGRGYQAHAKSGANGDGSAGENRSDMPVNTIKPHKKTLIRTLEQPGSIKPWAQAELFAKTSGYLKQITREKMSDGTLGAEIDIGSRVSAGEILVEIDVPELVQEVAQKESILKQSEAELEQAKTNVAACVACVDFASKQMVRLKDLAKSNNVSQELVDEKQSEISVFSSRLANAKAEIQVREAKVQVARADLERARVLAEYAHIHAPFDGVITYRGFDVGDFVQNATTGQPHPLLTVTAIDKVKFVLQVPEKESALVQRGAEVRIADWGLKGTISRVNPSLDAQSRTRQVEVDLGNADRKLVPGLYAEATLILQKIENAQAIPATAVFSRRGENYIIQAKDGVAHRQRVRIRFDDGKQLEVVKLIDNQEVPLDGTEELIVSNKGEIADGQHVRPTRLPAR